MLAGTITQLNGDGTFVANAFVVPGEDQGLGGGGGDQGGWGGGSGFHTEGDWNGSPPATTSVTISTDQNTQVSIDDQTASFGDLKVGDKFHAAFAGTPSGDLQTFLTGNPAQEVFAHAPESEVPNGQMYAFVGTVTGVDTTNNTVTVNVSSSSPTGFVPAGSQTFTVDAGTLILGVSGGGLSGGGLGAVNVGDTVAGGEIGTAGETLSQVESTPLQVLVDFPASAAGGTQTTAARDKAFHAALRLLGFKPAAVHKRTRKHRRHHHQVRRHHHKV